MNQEALLKLKMTKVLFLSFGFANQKYYRVTQNIPKKSKKLRVIVKITFLRGISPAF